MGEKMTIFQKMILVPVLSLLMYACFITYSYFEHQQSSEKIQQLREDYVPLLAVVNDNISLFKKLQDAFKDAVLAGESRWLKDNLATKEHISTNLAMLYQHHNVIDTSKLKIIEDDFNHYYENANKLALALLQEDEQWVADEGLLQSVNHYQSLSTTHFEAMKKSIQQRFKHTLNETQRLQSQLLFWGGVISFTSMILLMIVTLTISYSTRNSFFEIVQKAKELAQGSTDFSQRIERNNRDELGYLVHWFNKLSDKLEADYLALKEISITDKLTQLNNRNRTDQFLPLSLQEAKAHNTPFVLAIVDIDHFKQVNDTFGHQAGDIVLQLFASALKDSATESDYISRWGGEEFLLIWPNTNPVLAAQKANEIRLIVENMDFPTVGKVTASFGLASIQKSDTAESIIARADENLYQAKENGRNRVVIDQEISLI